MEKKASTCALHKGQKLKYYCMEEKCDKAICQSCITKHQGHRVKPLEIAMLEKKKKAEKEKKEGKKVPPAASPKKEVKKVAPPAPPKKEEVKKAAPPAAKV